VLCKSGVFDDYPFQGAVMPNQSNPFVLPGMGQNGEPGQNPLVTSMEMMSQAWQSFAGAGFGNSPVAGPMTVDELDRRVADLRIVENWLRLNMSMLASAIQGLEVQRATINTLASFMNMSASGRAPAKAAKDGKAPDAPATPAPGAGAMANLPAGAQAWWDMLQKQFNTLAAATVATMQGAESLNKPSATKEPNASGPARRGRSASKKTRS
jgi:hypothetical protein